MSTQSFVAIAAALTLLAGCDRMQSDSATDNAQTTKGVATTRPPENPGARSASCNDLPSASQLKQWLQSTPTEGEVGGLMGGKFEWAAVVDRTGAICGTAVATDDPSAAWPGSQAIAKAKAFTANAFSTDTTPMSTARLYTLSLPGHSLWSAANGNPFNPACLARTDHADDSNGKVCGGTIAFGGGLPLYKGKTRVGGLGVSGDTPCADHEIAKRIRNAAGLNPPTGMSADDIQYTSADGPTIWAHPLCPNTWRNGKKLGDEPSPVAMPVIEASPPAQPIAKRRR